MRARRGGLAPYLLATLAVAAASASAFDLQGHRGARGLAPENTLAGFRKALEIGVSTLELDLGLTRDGVLVVSHDPLLNPDVTRGPDGRWLPMSVGTTTSMRVDRFTRPLLARHGVRAVIGKGGLSADSLAAFAEHGGAYLAITGGAAALETVQIEAIEAVWWEDLMPECLWRFRVRGLGPLIVGMDAHRGDLYADVAAEARRRLGAIYDKLGVKP